MTAHGGCHILMRTLDENIGRKIRIVKDHPIDVLSSGYVLLPPSQINHSLCDKSKSCQGRDYTSCYEIVNSYRITEEYENVKCVMDSVLERCRQLGWSTKAKREKLDLHSVLNGLDDGERNEQTFRYAYHLLNVVKLSTAQIWTELQRSNSLSRPPMDERELRAIFESSLRYKESEVAIYPKRRRK